VKERYVKNVNYKHRKIFESYFSFAPKNVDDILGRDSMVDIKSGDNSNTKGTVGYIRLERGPEDVNGIWDMITEYQENNRGILINSSVDLAELKMLFPEDNDHAVAFGVDMCFKSKLRSTPFVFLHYTDFQYGVAGNNKQNIPYVLSEELSEVDEISKDFLGLNLGPVITESVYNREKDGISCRRIGTIRINSVDKYMPLYEVLDGCVDSQRRLKIETQTLLTEGLRLMGNKDYYLARNQFAEVIKKNPEDLLCRRYLFLCEDYLNR